MPALAQQAAPPSDQSQAGVATIEEVIVTALKRGTKLQETPISISAISGQTLQNSGVRDMTNLSATVPSLNIADGGPSARRVSIRGIASTGEPTVGTYYDETPVTGMIGANNDAAGTTPELRLFDVERVEVLRGPQGTLYGSGSMGGTLRIIYNKPSFRPEASVETSLSNTDGGGWNYDGSAMVNMPINDKVAVRATGFYRSFDGFVDNVRLGVDNINDEKTYGGRLLLRVVPTERLTIDAAAYINRSRSENPTYFSDLGAYKTDLRSRTPTRDNTNLYSLTGTYNFDNAALTGSVSYMDRSVSTFTDVSDFIRAYRQPIYCQYLGNGGAPCNPTQLAGFYNLVDGQSTSGLFPHQDLGAYTGELRLSSTGDKALSWTIGGFWSERTTDLNNPQVNVDPTTGEVITPWQISTQRFVRDRLTQKAMFGELGWNITDKLNLTVGLRYFDYDKSVRGQTTMGSVLVGSVTGPVTASSFSEDGFVKKFNLSYKATPDVMFYAEAAQGFRPGGVNQALGLPQQFANYSSDSLWNYEAGVKTSLFDRRMTFDIDAFQIDWSNLQVAARTTNNAFGFIGNAGSARVRGVEMETAIRPITGLTLNGSASYMDAELSEDQIATGLIAAGKKGDRMTGIPHWSGGLSAQYDHPVGEGLNLMTRLDTRYMGGSYSGFDPAAPTTRHQPSYALTNARIGIEGQDKGWGAYLYATNLLNVNAEVLVYNSPLTAARTNVVSAAPRTIGVNLRKSF